MVTRRHELHESDSGWHPLRCDVQSWRESVWIQPDGEIDYGTADVVQSTVARFLEAGFSHIVIDLRRVTFLDSSGLRALIKARQAAAEREIGFSVAPGPPGIRRLFEVTGTAALFPAPSAGPDGQAPLDPRASAQR
jgi:anti-sigma B factor antagonist